MTERTEREVLIASLTLLVKSGVFTLEEVQVAVGQGTQEIWKLLNARYTELDANSHSHSIKHR